MAAHIEESPQDGGVAKDGHVLEPLDFALLTHEAMLGMAVRMAENSLAQIILDNTSNSKAAHLRMMTRLSPESVTDRGGFTEIAAVRLGRKRIHPEPAARFAANTAGKATTSAGFTRYSDVAVRDFGLQEVADGNEDDPRSWPGGVYHESTFTLNDQQYRLEVVAAVSGVQGVFDKVIAAAAASYYAGLWQLHLTSN